MSENHLKVVAIIVPVIVLLMLRIFLTAKRITRLEVKSENMETDIIDMDKRHNTDIQKIELSIESIKYDNRKEHETLFKKFDANEKILTTRLDKINDNILNIYKDV